MNDWSEYKWSLIIVFRDDDLKQAYTSLHFYDNAAAVKAEASVRAQLSAGVKAVIAETPEGDRMVTGR